MLYFFPWAPTPRHHLLIIDQEPVILHVLCNLAVEIIVGGSRVVCWLATVTPLSLLAGRICE